MNATSARSRAVCAALLATMIVTAAGCATMARGLKAIDQGLERASNALSFASWQHFLFSARMNARIVTFRPPVALPGDAATATREGGWWGDTVPVAE